MSADQQMVTVTVTDVIIFTIIIIINTVFSDPENAEMLGGSFTKTHSLKI